MKTYRVVAGLVIIAIIVIVVYHFVGARHGPQSGIVTEKISKDGDVWKVDFTARMAAPENAVFDALRHPEDVHAAGIKSVTVVSATPQEKIVDLVVQGPTGRALSTRETYHYFPDQKRVTFTTTNNPVVAGSAVYQLTPAGAATIINFHEEARLLVQMPVPDMVVRARIRQTAIADLENLRQRLHLPESAQSSSDEAEP